MGQQLLTPAWLPQVRLQVPQVLDQKALDQGMREQGMLGSAAALHHLSVT
jgi:hypothetical protein